MKPFSEEPLKPEVIADFKEKHKNVFEITVGEGDEPKVTGYFRKPTISELSVLLNGDKEKIFDQTLTMFNTCLLGGHPSFETDDDVKLAAIQVFSEVIKARQASIKKL